MKSNSTKFIVVVAFVLTLGAGVMAGLLSAKLPRAATPQVAPTIVRSALADELDLTPDQSAKMKEIWEGVNSLNDQSLIASQRIQDERDRKVGALVAPDKIDAYNAIMRKAAEDNASLKAKRDAAFDKAVKETKLILSPPQQDKYQSILAKRLGGESPQSRAPIGEATGPITAGQPSS